MLDNGGTLAAKDGRLQVSIREQLDPKPGFHDRRLAEVIDAVRVLIAARPRPLYPSRRYGGAGLVEMQVGRAVWQRRLP